MSEPRLDCRGFLAAEEEGDHIGSVSRLAKQNHRVERTRVCFVGYGNISADICVLFALLFFDTGGVMGSAVQGLKVPGQDPVQQVMQMSFGIWVVAAMRAALECEVAEHLASGPKSAAELARKAGANEDALCRCLRALAGTGVFTEVAPGVFAN